MRCFNIMDYLSTTKKNLISNRKIKPQIYSVNNNTVCLYSSNYKIIIVNNSDYLQKARKYGHFTGYKN